MALLSHGARIGVAAESIGVTRQAVYWAKRHDPQFAAEFEQAVEAGNSALEDEAVRRGVEGYDEPVFYQGKRTEVVRKYSDTLLLALLRARLPDKYRDRVSQEITGAAGGPLKIEDLHPLEAKQRLLAIMERLRGPQETTLALPTPAPADEPATQEVIDAAH